MYMLGMRNSNCEQERTMKIIIFFVLCTVQGNFDGSFQEKYYVDVRFSSV